MASGVPTKQPEERSLAELLGDGLFVDGDWVESKDQDPAGEVRLVQLTDIGDGIFRNRSSRFLTMAKANELGCTFLEPGDILIARMPEPLGRASIFPGVNQPAVTAVDVCILRPNRDRVDAEWLVDAINSPQFRSSMQPFVRGTTRQRISRTNLGTLRLRKPPLDEQVRLARWVHGLEASRTAAAHHLASGRRAIARARQALLLAACSGRLTGSQDQWHTVPAKALFKWSSGKGLTSKDMVRGDIPVYGGNGISGYHDSALVQSPTVVIGRVGALCGNVYLTGGPAWVTDNAIYAKVISSDVSPAWAELVFSAANLNSRAGGSSQPFVNQTILNGVDVPVPPRHKQAEAVRRYQEMAALVDRLATLVEDGMVRVEQSQGAILAKAFRGDLLSGEG